MTLTRFCLILMLIGFLPANIYSAMNHVDFGGHGEGPGYLLFRVPFQFFVVWWTYYATKQNSPVKITVFLENEPSSAKPRKEKVRNPHHASLFALNLSRVVRTDLVATETQSTARSSSA
jgi:hypothetical protein